MKKFSINEKIPVDLCKRIVSCVEVVLNDTSKRFLREHRLATTNGLPILIYDWINTELLENIPAENTRVIPFSRFGWKGKMIIDDHNLVTYTIMREKGLKRVKKQHRSSPHYLQTLVSVLNTEFEAQVKQMTIDGWIADNFSEEEYLNDFNSLCGGSIMADEGYTHALILFDTVGGQLSGIRVCVLDKDLDVAEERCLKEFIKPDYNRLTEIVATGAKSELPQDISNQSLLKLTEKSIIKLKEAAKEA